MTIEIAETVVISAGSESRIQVACDRWLDPPGEDLTDETISAVDTPVELVTADLTIDREAVNGIVVVDGRKLAASKSFLFFVVGQVAGTTYQIKISFTTSKGRIEEQIITAECK